MSDSRSETRRRVRAAHDSGFTVIEVVIAALLLALGVLAVLGLVDAATRNSSRAEQSQVVNDVLQQEMEKIKQLPYANVALSGVPIHSTDSTSPNLRVSGTQFNVNKTGPAASWNLVYNNGHSNETGATVSGGTVDPGPTPFHNGNVSGQIYRYVVWEPEASCTNCAHSVSSDFYQGQRVGWYKHIVIAVALAPTAASGVRPYQEIQGDIGNPDAGQDTCTDAGCPGKSTNNSTPWTFWLTDTSCNNDFRQPVTGDHLAHDTMGRCSDGQQSGSTFGAPDLMYTQGAPCANNDCNTDQPLYDYATEVEPGCQGINCSGQDKGLSEVPPSQSGCLLNTAQALAPYSSALELPSTEANPQLKVHKWLSQSLPSDWPSSVILDGTGSLDLWTKAPQSAQAGRICIWLFTRHLNATGIPIDLPALNGTNIYQSYTQSPWPADWTEIHVALNFTQLTLVPGYRLGLAIGIDKGGTTASGLDFMYDHPTYDSRLVVNTQSALPF